MDVDVDDQHFLEQLHESQKKDRIVYTRDFLLSLSELDVCKKLSSDFDVSILSDFEGFFYTSPDRQRPSGSVSSQSLRRTEYGSSPPTRGDSSNYSRATHGRWESRSRDSDSQSDLDSDSGRRFGNHSRRSSTNSEHDGLLGSGSFPRPSGYASGAPAPKFQTNDPAQLKKCNEPYQPPRPYKAVNSRRDTRDSLNDETFGAADTTEDRAEEERKRRASFELMRKEQHKALQEKQKSNSDKKKGDSVSDMDTLLEGSKDDKLFFNKNTEINDSVTMKAPHNDSSKPLIPSQTLTSRPLVPPGFTTTSLEKKLAPKSMVHAHPIKVENPQINDCLLNAGAIPMLNATSDHHAVIQLDQKLVLSEKQLDNMSIDLSSIKINERMNLPSEVPDKKIGMDEQSYKSISISGTSDTIELDVKKDYSTPVLEQLFGSGLKVKTGDTSSFIEHQDLKRDEDTWSPSRVQSSKFAHWFLEEKKAVDEFSTGRPNDLLSLFVSGGEGKFQVSNSESIEKFPSNSSFRNSEFSKRDAASDLSTTPGILNKSEVVSAVLTCEDLEQSILSGINDKSLVLQPSAQGLNLLVGNMGKVKANIDNRASQHLLSLLNKGPGPEITESPLNLDTESFGKQNIFGANNLRETTPQKINDTSNSLTLETLFGTAFMNELQSFEAPVSVHRASGVPGRVNVPVSHGLIFPANDNNAPHSAIGDTGPNWPGYENPILEQNYYFNNDPRAEVNSSNLKTEIGFKLSGFDGAGDIRLPEEDSLIRANAPRNNPNSLFMSDMEPTNTELISSLNRPTESDVRYQNIRGQPSFPQVHHPNINQGRPSFHHQLDSHPTQMNSQMKFPDNMIHHDLSSNHLFSGNMARSPFLYPNAGFDAPHPMLQQMQRPGSFPPAHHMQGFSGNVPRPTHLDNHGTGFIRGPEMQGFSIGHRPPSFRDPGMPQPVPNLGGVGNHPEELQRLIEMELRSNPKQINPSASRGQGMYGHELDMGFRYR